MTCGLCQWLCTWLCSDTAPAQAAFWKHSEAWESAHSNEYELWSAISDQARERLNAAKAIREMNPAEAFRIYRELADAGVFWAMEMMAYQYWTGIGVARDFEQAQAYYCRAIEAGSWMATLRYARLLVSQGQFDAAHGVLQDGVQAGFIPAFYWLARLRYRRLGSRRTIREIVPLLEHAARAGHPAAALFLARLRMVGKLGVGEIMRGFREIAQIAGQAGSLAESRPTAAATS